MFDTYISDPKIWQELRNLSHDIDAERNTVNRVLLRSQRVQKFYGYMHSCLTPLVLESQKRGLPAQWCHDVMKERANDLQREVDRVIASAKKNYGSAEQKQNAGAVAREDEEDFSDV